MADKDIARDGLESFLSTNVQGVDIKDGGVVTSRYYHVVPDSGYWDSLDTMINYFTQVKELDRREILVCLENMKKRGIIVLQGMILDDTTPVEEGVQTDGSEEGRILKKKQRWEEGENDDNKGLMEQIKEAEANGEIKPYESMSLDDFHMKFQNYSEQYYPVIDSKTYLTEEALKKVWEGSVERDLSRCK